MTTHLNQGPTGRRPGRLTTLTLQGFRGFNRPVTLDFDASAVLLHGANGTGKTSVFDALQWLLTGDLPRIAQMQMRRSEQYIRNAYAVDEDAFVTATFGTAPHSITATRRGSARGSVLSVDLPRGSLEGAAAEAKLAAELAPGSLPLPEVLHTTGMLQQDEMRELLRTKPDARYRQLMRLLGLEGVDTLDRAVSGRRKSAREKTKAVEAAVATARREATRLREELETTLLQVERATAAVEPGGPLTIDEANAVHLRTRRADDTPNSEGWGDDLAQLRRATAKCLDLLAGLPDQLPESFAADEPSRESTLRRAQSDLSKAVLLEQSAARDVEEARATASLLARLSAVAMQVLPDVEEMHPCPVCEQAINPSRVRESLIDRTAATPALLAAEASLEQASARRADAEAVVREAAAAVDEARERTEAFNRFHADVRAVMDWLKVIGSLKYLETGPLSLIRGNLAEDTSVQSRAVRSQLQDELRRITEAADELDTALRDRSQKAAVARLAAERSAAIPRQRALLAEAEEEVRQMEQELEYARQREVDAVTQAETATAAAAEIFKIRFAMLEPLMNDVYARLDPHPSFTKLTFTVDSFRSKGTATATVRDDGAGISINPMLIFSAAQANIVVLSAFLALGWAGGRNTLPFVLLDDPLQALDDVNVLGFADLARHLRRQKQLIVATHEARFAALLERKLSGYQKGEDLVIHQFMGWTRSGPNIETIRVNPKSGTRKPVLVA